MSDEAQFRRALLGPRPWPWAGVVVCVALTVAAHALHDLPVSPFTTADGQHPLSAVLLALVLGILVRNLVPASARLRAGAGVVLKTWLPVGIVLLGAGLDFYALLDVGLRALLAALVLIVVVVLATAALARALQLRPRLGLLIGIGTAICGTSAIVATAPVIEAEDDDMALSVATVNLFGVTTILVFPAVAALAQLAAPTYGLWCGLSIHATPQVIAAGFAHFADGQTAGELATIVKLTRVSLLAPAVLLVGLLYARKRRQEAVYVARPVEVRRLVPGFIALFLLMALLRTLGCLPEVTLHMTERFPLGAGDRDVDLALALGTAAKWIITCSMAAVGLGIELRSLRAGGAKPFVLGLLATLVAAIVGLACALLLA